MVTVHFLFLKNGKKLNSKSYKRKIQGLFLKNMSINIFFNNIMLKCYSYLWELIFEHYDNYTS